jgi:hypothetical protein
LSRSQSFSPSSLFQASSFPALSCLLPSAGAFRGLLDPGGKLGGLFPRIRPFGAAATSLLLLAGCSSGSRVREGDIERTSGFQVSVHSNGREVKNFEQELVHRTTLSRQALIELQRYAKNETLTVPRKDERGGFEGLKVRSGVPRPILDTLGLRSGDVVTALGTRKVEPSSSFEEYLLAIGSLSDSSLTFERRGVPHKVIYSIEGSGTGAAGSPSSRETPTDY